MGALKALRTAGGLGRGERGAIAVAWLALFTTIGLYASGCCDCGCSCGCGDSDCPDNTTGTKEGCISMFKPNWDAAGATFPPECCVELPPADDCQSECKNFGVPTDPANPLCTPPVAPATGPSTTPPGTAAAKKAIDALGRASDALAASDEGEGPGEAAEAASQDFASSASAATAGNLGSKKEGKASPTPETGPSAGPAGKRTAGAAGKGGGGDFKMDGTSTAAIGAGSGTGGMDQSAASDGGAYAGGGKGGGEGAGGAGDGGFAYNPGGAGGGGAGEMNFGGQGPAGGDIPAMAGSDPDDYFTRTSPDENIFKKVERKYGEKATGWALEEAKGHSKK